MGHDVSFRSETSGAGDTDLDIFGFGSRPVRWALAGFGVAYVTATVGTGLHVTMPWRWVGLFVAFVLFMITAWHLLRVRGDRCSRRAALSAAGVVLVAAAIAWWSLPLDYRALQTGPAIAGSIVVLTLVAVRGRPVIAWVGALLMSTLCGLWAISRGFGFAFGVTNTLWGYPVLVLAALFLIYLRPMATRIAGLRAEAVRGEAAAAATAAAAEERRHHFEEFERRARPVLEQIVGGREFTLPEVTEARLLEAQLRDSIRAPGWDSPALRDAAWKARDRGVAIVLLDDGALNEMGDDDRALLQADLTRVVIDELGAGIERLTARIMPPGRSALASIVVDAGDETRRVEMTSTGELIVETSRSSQAPPGSIDDNDATWPP